jgi:leucyl/phenylalanyl-tRNA---protein transferase
MLEPELLLDAYRHGIFPMAVNPDLRVGAGKRGDIGWFSPDPRAIIPLDQRFHIPHGLRRVLKKCLVEGEASAEPKHTGLIRRGSARKVRAEPSKPRFVITFDADFESVIRECAKRKEGTWISKEIIESYCNLHRLGHAHSVEVWLCPKTEIPRHARNDKRNECDASTPHASRSTRLAGGLYGVHIGGAFFGESMFHRVTDASKVALVALVERLHAHGFVLLDTQWQTPHLAQFGTFEIPRREYLGRLERALKLDCNF